MIQILNTTNTTLPDNVVNAAVSFGKYFLKSEKDLSAITFENATLLGKKLPNGVRIFVIYAGDIFVYKNPTKNTLSTLSYLEDTWVASLGNLSINEYGNTDWKGTDGTTLCWKGVASRHFEVDNTIGVPTYMLVDEEVDGMPPITYYTPFGPKIYADGSILDTIPNGGATIHIGGVLQEDVLTLVGSTEPKVMGCAYTKYTVDKTERTLLVAMVSMNYRGTTNPQGTTGGFYDEIYGKIDGKWSRLGFTPSSRPNANWFFNQSGTEASCVNYGYVRKLNLVNLISTFSVMNACTGNTSESKVVVDDGPYGADKTYPSTAWTDADPADYTAGLDSKIGGSRVATRVTISEVQTCIVAIDYKEDVPIIVNAQYQLNELSEYLTDKYGIFSWLKIVPYLAPDDPVPNTPANCVYVGMIPSLLVGTCAPFTWTMQGGTCDADTGQVISLNTCSSGAPKTVTFTVTDARGHTASLTHNAVGGNWVFKSSTFYGTNIGPCYSASCSGSTDGGPMNPNYSQWDIRYHIHDYSNKCYSGAIVRGSGTFYVQGSYIGECEYNITSVTCGTYYEHGFSTYAWECP